MFKEICKSREKNQLYHHRIIIPTTSLRERSLVEASERAKPLLASFGRKNCSVAHAGTEYMCRSRDIFSYNLPYIHTTVHDLSTIILLSFPSGTWSIKKSIAAQILSCRGKVRVLELSWQKTGKVFYTFLVYLLKFGLKETPNETA